MDPTHAVPSAKKNRSDSGSSRDSSSDSSGSSSSSSAVGTDSSNKNDKVEQVDTSSSNSSGSSLSSAAVSTDSSNKTPVAKIVLHGDDDADITDFVDNGGGYEGNDSNKGNESDDDDKKDDGYNNATKEVIFDCAAGTQCKAPPSANLADSPHSCWGCNKKIHSSLLCGESILNLLSNTPSYIGRSLSNGCLIQEDENNETRALCFKCIALLLEARKFEEAQKLNARMSDMLAVLPPTARMEASPQKLEARSVPPMTRREDFLGKLECDWLSHSCVRKTETPDTCTQCNLHVHFQCQLSWERYVDLSHEKKCTSRVCREHHPKYQHWRELHIKPVAVHEKEAREKEVLNLFVRARESEHKGANYHQCQVLD